MPKPRRPILLAAALAAGLTGSYGVPPATAQDDAASVEAGRMLAQATCAECHVIGDVPAGWDVDGVPTFKAVADDPAVTAAALKAFFATPHVEMPDLMFTDAESDHLVAYILSLKSR